jgi:TorA maturation chaperone TorD
MEEIRQQRVFIYAFLSRVFSDVLDKKSVIDLKSNIDLLETLGTNTVSYFQETELSKIESELNIDFSSMFLLHTQPIESFVLDSKQEALVGLSNPVMQFYYNSGFEIDMNSTSIVAPDHLSIEFGFMQTLAGRDEVTKSMQFLDKHLISWVIPYLLGMKSMATTPFFRDLFDFTVEFLVSDYETLKQLKASQEAKN